MEAKAQLVPGYFVWEIPGKPAVVHLHLDVVDRLLGDVMRGFGAVPKRGAEVGGILIGVIEHGDPSIVRIEDYEAIGCSYSRGPSYLFDDDFAVFEAACKRWAPDESRPVYAVGYFRSHTRDGLSLTAEDLKLLDRFFPSESQVALLIRPYGSKVSIGGFFLRDEGGSFPPSTPLEFPFRRRELSGEETPRRPAAERRPREREFLRPLPPADDRGASESDHDAPWLQPGPAYAAAAPARPRMRSGSVWVPLSFIFLLLGVLLGFQTALTISPKASAGAAQDFSLGLSVTQSGDNLSVRWNRQAPAIHAARTGLLEIEDSGTTKSVDLDTIQLQNGSVIYRNSSNDVRFRLVVYPRAALSVTETIEWKQ